MNTPPTPESEPTGSPGHSTDGLPFWIAQLQLLRGEAAPRNNEPDKAPPSAPEISVPQLGYVKLVNPPYGPDEMPECEIQLADGKLISAKNYVFPTLRLNDPVCVYPLTDGGWSLSDPAWELPGWGVEPGTTPPTRIDIKNLLDFSRNKSDKSLESPVLPEVLPSNGQQSVSAVALDITRRHLESHQDETIRARARGLRRKITYGDPILLSKPDRERLLTDKVCQLSRYGWVGELSSIRPSDLRQVMQIGDPTSRPVKLVPLIWEQAFTISKTARQHPNPGLFLLAMDAICRAVPDGKIPVKVVGVKEEGLSVDLFGVSQKVFHEDLSWGVEDVGDYAPGMVVPMYAHVRRDVSLLYLTALPLDHVWERIIAATPVGTRLKSWDTIVIRNREGVAVNCKVDGLRVKGLAPEGRKELAPFDSSTEWEVTGHDPANRRLLLAARSKRPPLQTDLTSGLSVSGRVTGTVPKGLLLDIQGTAAFMPQNEVDLQRPKNLAEYAHQTLECLIIEVDTEQRLLLVSRRKLLEARQREAKKRCLSTLKAHQLCKGVVKKLADFGAFVDLGGIEGLLHISDMSWEDVTSPGAVVQINQEVEVYILSIDHEKEKISLSLKHMTPNPWLNIETKYPKGSRHQGEVVNMLVYGAFVKLEPGIEGLVHISEMSWMKRVSHPKELVSIGQMIEVQVLNINLNKNEISLGMKQCLRNPWDSVEGKYLPGMQITGIVRNLANYGAFIELEEGIDGLLHNSDMSWVRKVTNPIEVVQKGQCLTCLVLSVDSETKRIALGLKQLQPDPWTEIIPSRYIPGQKYRGRVTKLTNFGVFIELEPDLEGLLHMSELSDGSLVSAKGVVKPGDEVDVKVLHVDLVERRIGLSMRNVDDPTVPDHTTLLMDSGPTPPPPTPPIATPTTDPTVPPTIRSAELLAHAEKLTPSGANPNE